MYACSLSPYRIKRNYVYVVRSKRTSYSDIVNNAMKYRDNGFLIPFGFPAVSESLKFLIIIWHYFYNNMKILLVLRAFLIPVIIVVRYRAPTFIDTRICENDFNRYCRYL